MKLQRRSFDCGRTPAIPTFCRITTISALEHGKFVFSRSDLTVYKLSSCGGGEFCSTPLVQGELVGAQEVNSLVARGN